MLGLERERIQEQLIVNKDKKKKKFELPWFPFSKVGKFFYPYKKKIVNWIAEDFTLI